MKITSVESVPVRVPLRGEFLMRSALGEGGPVSTYVLVCVHTDEGLVGLGECTGTDRWSGEPLEVARVVIDGWLAPALVGEDPTQIERLNVKLERATKAHPFAKSAVEMALWDLTGKKLGVPVATLLGGSVREQLPLKWSVPAKPPEEAAEIARRAVGMGFTLMKVKVGLDAATDVARVRAVRAAVGASVKIGIDGNAGWSVRETLWAVQRLRECDLWFIEQPIHGRNLAGLVDIRRQTGIPVMADEAVWTPEDGVEVIRQGAADIISVYPGKNGGILNCKKIIAMAQAAGLTCVLGSNLELGIASAAMLHVGCSSPAISEEIGHHVIGPLYHQEDVVAPSLSLAAGVGHLTTGAGLGVELDEEKVARYRVAG